MTGAPPVWTCDDARYYQLEAGRCRARRALLRTSRIEACCERWSVGMLKLGSVPRGTVAFLVHAGHAGDARIQGRPVAPGEIAVRLEGEEYHYRSSGPARLLTVTIRRSALEEHVRREFDRNLGALRLQGSLSRLRAEPSEVRRLCRALVAREADDSFRPVSRRGRGLEGEVLRVLLGRVGPPVAPERPCPGRGLALRAEAWLRQNLQAAPTVLGLCAALDVSERTLHEAFRQHLGTTPMAYLKTLRLNAARHDLQRAETSTRVTDVALDWGFQHFGWFAHDYRRLFAETPSDTLRCGRSEATRRPAAAGPLVRLTLGA